jgi:hypothetical protein
VTLGVGLAAFVAGCESEPRGAVSSWNSNTAQQPVQNNGATNAEPQPVNSSSQAVLPAGSPVIRDPAVNTAPPPALKEDPATGVYSSQPK